MRKMVVVLIAALAIPSLALADSDRPGSRGSGRAELMKELNLNKEQIEIARKIRLEMRKKMISLGSELELKRLDFQEELHKEDPDKAVVERLIDEMSELAAKQSRARLEAQVKMVEMLTADQKKKLMERMSKKLLTGAGGRGGAGFRRGGRPDGD